MQNKIPFIKLFSLFFITILISGISRPELVAQKVQTPLDEPKAVTVVKEYWATAQKGRTRDAEKLETNVYHGIGLEPPKSEPSWAEVIRDVNLKLISIDQVEVDKNGDTVIAALVQNQNGRRFYLFHTVVELNGKLRIRTISF